MGLLRTSTFVAPAILALALSACAAGSDSTADDGLDQPIAGSGGKAGAAGKGGKGGAAGKGGTTTKGGAAGAPGGEGGSGGVGNGGKAGEPGKGGASGKAGTGGKGGGGGDGEGGASGDGGSAGKGDGGSVAGTSGTGGAAGKGDGGSAGKAGGAGGTSGAGGKSGAAGAAGGKPLGGFGGSAGAPSKGGAGGVAGGGGSKASVCGNGLKELGEPCDGSDFGTQDCATVTGDPTFGGKLKCETCKIRTDACTKKPVCGDGKANDVTEQCDGNDVGTATCASVTNDPNKTGSLGCTAGCKIDTSSCKDGNFCGDGTKNQASEECDKLDVGTATCASVLNNPAKVGELRCASTCKFDTSLCADTVSCGDGKRNQATESCDGTDLAGGDCKTFLSDAKAVGTLACKPDCTYDGAGCSVPPYCGDGTLNGAEACDTAAFGTATCESIKGLGWSGSLTCTPDCKVSSTSCEKLPVCGDNDVNTATETCDGTDLNGASCGTAVPGSTGNVTCNGNCTLDTTGCTVPPKCGNGMIDQNETCEGTNFEGKTCKTILGNVNAAGSLVCTNCSIDASGCSIPAYCGDGKLNQGSEECDDGANVNGDGCDSNCKVVCRFGLKLGTHCYEEVAVSRTWSAAQADCASVSGYLATFTTAAEESFVRNSVMTAPGINEYWIGFTDSAAEGSFKWVTGEPVSYTHWGSSEPNNSGGNEDCTELRWSANRWNDESCSTGRSYVCEYSPPIQFP